MSLTAETILNGLVTHIEAIKIPVFVRLYFQYGSIDRGILELVKGETGGNIVKEHTSFIKDDNNKQNNNTVCLEMNYNLE